MLTFLLWSEPSTTFHILTFGSVLWARPYIELFTTIDRYLSLSFNQFCLAMHNHEIEKKKKTESKFHLIPFSTWFCYRRYFYHTTLLIFFSFFLFFAIRAPKISNPFLVYFGFQFVFSSRMNKITVSRSIEAFNFLPISLDCKIKGRIAAVYFCQRR